MSKKQAITVFVGIGALWSGAAFGQLTGSTTLSLDLKALDFAGSRATGTMYMPNSVILSDKKPAFVKHEPAYKGVPQYAIVSLGNGPRRQHAIAIDVPNDDSDARIFVDVDGTGDLSGGDGKWGEKTVSDGIAQYSGTYVFRTSYGNATKESSSGSYGLNFYWSPGRASLNYYRASVRSGKIKLGKQTYSVKIIENNNDGVFNVPFTVGSKHTKPVWLVLDGNMLDVRGTFSLEGYNYQGYLSADGSRFTMKPTSRAVKEPVAAASPRELSLLAVGTEAPDFEVPAFNGGTVRLSNLRGKIVVLDFWATWCGPCKASLPHVQKVWDQVKDKNVYVLALNVFDDKPAYDQWIPANKSYTFPFAYDPAGRGNGSIAKNQYNVSGIPTTYVIGPDGKIAASILGFGGLSDHRLEEALAKLNVPIEAPKTVPMIGLGSGK